MMMMMVVMVGDDGEEGLSTDYVGLKAEKLPRFCPHSHPKQFSCGPKLTNSSQQKQNSYSQSDLPALEAN